MFLFLEQLLLKPLVDWLILFIHQGTYIPILLLAFEESGIPMPIPGDAMVAYSGYNIYRGRLNYEIALISLMAAILVGSSILFWLSSRWGNLIILKFGKFLHLHPERLLTVEKVFKKYGPWVIIFGRHIPGFRIPITVFAGMSGVKYKTFILSTLVSTIFWVIFYLDLGIRLGRRIGIFLRVSSSHLILYGLIILLVFILFIIFQIKRYKSS